jgi:DNA-binding beta-propeller fold protein YncE
VGSAGAGDGQFAGNGPAGIALHGDEVYVTDLGNNRVQVFDRDGRFRRKWGSAGAGDRQFNTPGVLPAAGDLATEATV